MLIGLIPSYAQIGVWAPIVWLSFDFLRGWELERNFQADCDAW